MNKVDKKKPVFIQLDSLRCQGHNRCYLIAPELFDMDEFGLASLISSQAVPSELLDKAVLAEKNCPEFAITLINKSGT